LNKRLWKRWGWTMAALLLLGGVTAESLHRPTRSDAAPYHALVRQRVLQIPQRIGDWIGEDIPVPQEAQTLLRPNAILHRQFHNIKTGQQVGLLLTQCERASDMVGHYPPVCYPNNGWELLSTEPVTIRAAQWVIPAKLYELAMPHFNNRSGRQLIYNFMILPSGDLVADMDGVRRTAADYTQTIFGAGQIQIVFTDATIDAQQREAICATFIEAIRPVIQAILRGIDHD